MLWSEVIPSKHNHGRLTQKLRKRQLRGGKGKIKSKKKFFSPRTFVLFFSPDIHTSRVSTVASSVRNACSRTQKSQLHRQLNFTKDTKRKNAKTTKNRRVFSRPEKKQQTARNRHPLKTEQQKNGFDSRNFFLTFLLCTCKSKEGVDKINKNSLVPLSPQKKRSSLWSELFLPFPVEKLDIGIHREGGDTPSPVTNPWTIFCITCLVF